MFNAITEEHKFEFTGEMERKQALIRWNLLGTKLDEAKQKMFYLQQRIGSYFDIPTIIYYKYAADDESLIIYGLNHGELFPPEGYTEFEWDNLTDEKINGLYRAGANPDQRQFWPIWQVFLDSSNGLLLNDYGY